MRMHGKLARNTRPSNRARRNRLADIEGFISVFVPTSLRKRNENVEADLDLGLIFQGHVALGRSNSNRLVRLLATVREIDFDGELIAHLAHLDVFHVSVFPCMGVVAPSYDTKSPSQFSPGTGIGCV